MAYIISEIEAIYADYKKWLPSFYARREREKLITKFSNETANSTTEIANKKDVIAECLYERVDKRQ